ncbi:hypothetical protein, partial [Bacillus mycoides]|uniref:hypothetical protein n=1 Tax=Bacillus mycoides TaxID=1405 RepID=UPI001C930A41
INPSTNIASQTTLQTKTNPTSKSIQTKLQKLPQPFSNHYQITRSNPLIQPYSFNTLYSYQ